MPGSKRKKKRRQSHGTPGRDHWNLNGIPYLAELIAKIPGVRSARPDRTFNKRRNNVVTISRIHNFPLRVEARVGIDGGAQDIVISFFPQQMELAVRQIFALFEKEGFVLENRTGFDIGMKKAEESMVGAASIGGDSSVWTQTEAVEREKGTAMASHTGSETENSQAGKRKKLLWERAYELLFDAAVEQDGARDDNGDPVLKGSPAQILLERGLCSSRQQANNLSNYLVGDGSIRRVGYKVWVVVMDPKKTELPKPDEGDEEVANGTDVQAEDDSRCRDDEMKRDLENWEGFLWPKALALLEALKGTDFERLSASFLAEGLGGSGEFPSRADIESTVNGIQSTVATLEELVEMIPSLIGALSEAQSQLTPFVESYDLIARLWKMKGGRG